MRAVGGQSQKASLVTATAALATMLVLAPLLGQLPNAVLAAVVIVYSVGVIQPAEFRSIRRVRTMVFRWALIARLGVMVLGTLKGILVAVVVSLFALIIMPAAVPSTCWGANGERPPSSGPSRQSIRRTRLSRGCCW